MKHANIFACLVHENFECIVDLLQNLRYFDRDSLVLLYDGGESATLLPGKFPYARFNATIVPDPQPMRWGRLHRFAFDCLRYAVENYEFESLTIVDSDQLLLRSGYSSFIGDFLRRHPRVGLVVKNCEPLKPDTPIHPARAALSEAGLWRPLLEEFPGTATRFAGWTTVYWSLWPGTVFSAAAARQICDRFLGNQLLEEILAATGIVATEEILFPTLVMLLGYDLAGTPCVPRYVRWRRPLALEELEAARGELLAFWAHPVTRDYADPARTRLRTLCDGYLRSGIERVDFRSGSVTAHNAPIDAAGIITTARGIEGWLADGEAEALIAAARQAGLAAVQREAAFVEIGSYCGKSTVVLGLAARTLDRPVRILAIDPFQGCLGAADGGIVHTQPTFDRFLDNIRKEGLAGIVQPLRAPSYQVSWEGPIDLLFIDGLHDYPNVARDFHHFAASVEPGGLVVFHDYAPYYPGVRTFVEELLADGCYEVIRQVDSLAVLRKSNAAAIAVPVIAVPSALDRRQRVPRSLPPIGPGHPDASIIVPAHNEGRDVFLTLEALHAATDLCYEVIVVDDGSTDGCCDFLRRSGGACNGARLIAQTRRGVVGAREAGERLANAPYLVFLDGHCFPEPGWLARLLSVLEREDGCIAGPCVTVAGSRASKGYGITFSGPDLSVQWLGRRSEITYEVPMVGGCCMAMRRSFFRSIGGFDAMRSYGFEDAEICIRAWLFGYSVRVVPDADVAHRFKPATNFQVAWDDYLYNAMRLARLHFEGERLERITVSLRSKPDFERVAAKMFTDDLWDRYAFVRSRRRLDADWLCRKFELRI